MFDDEPGFELYDDAEVWANTLSHIGQSMIDSLFRYRAERWPTMSDRDFLPVLDAVRTDIGELLGPEELKELWDWTCGAYADQFGEKQSRAQVKVREAVLQSCLPDWHKIASEAKPAPPPKSRRRKKRK